MYMKKRYILPEMKVQNLSLGSIICVSGDGIKKYEENAIPSGSGDDGLAKEFVGWDIDYGDDDD